MAKADGGLRRDIQKFLPKPDWRWTPIETGGTHNGVPDSYFTNVPNRVSGWVECKATDGWAVKLESHQIQWLTLHADAGVPCWVFIRARGVGSAAGKGDALYVAAGRLADALSLQGLKLPKENFELINYGPAKSWDWGTISKILTGELKRG